MIHRGKNHPILYEINTRLWLKDLSARCQHEITLASVPEEELERIADLGFDLIWLMGVWQCGSRSTAIARAFPGLQDAYRTALPDLAPGDIGPSPYSLEDYSVDPRLGGPQGLASLRGRLEVYGVGLILDFVTNHTGIDHGWIEERPELYIAGSEEDLSKEPQNYFRVEALGNGRILAHGRNPHFAGWTDTAQLNVLHPATRAALRGVLGSTMEQCDGVRCDMAILHLDEVFRRTWGARALDGLRTHPESEFWSDIIGSARGKRPGFLFLAEAYWGLEGKLQNLGFDFTYDKALYDHLLQGTGQQVRRHLEADISYQERCVRFVENHDEPRAAAAFPADRHRAAAVIAATTPGLAFFHDGQLEGRRIRVPVQLLRRPAEPPDPAAQEFYVALLRTLQDPIFRRGRWRLIPVRPAWDGNVAWEDFVAYEWRNMHLGSRWVAVNFSPAQGQCYLEVGVGDGLAGKTVELIDLLGDAHYFREGDQLSKRGLYLDMPAFGYHFFDVRVRR